MTDLQLVTLLYSFVLICFVLFLCACTQRSVCAFWRCLKMLVLVSTHFSGLYFNYKL